MRRITRPEDNQTKAYIVPYDDGEGLKGWKIWRPDWEPHLSVLVWFKEKDAQAQAERVNAELERKGFGK